MPNDYRSKWVDAAGTFFLVDPYVIAKWTGDDFSQVIPAAQSQGPGEYAGDAIPETRAVTISGILQGTDPDDFQQKWQTLVARFARPYAGRLYKDSEHYLECRCDGVRRDDDTGLDWCAWSASFRVSQPMYVGETTGASVLNPNGTTVLAIGGGYATPLKISITVSAIGVGGRVIVTHTDSVGNFETFQIIPSATGEYIIDARLGVKGVTKAGVNVIQQFSGAFFELVEPSGATITIGTTFGAAVSAASAAWRRYYPAA